MSQQVKCNSRHVAINVIEGCQKLQQLSRALKYYHSLNPSINVASQDTFSNFCLHHYHELLNDIHHLHSKHEDQLHQIKQELTNKYQFPNCNAKNCSFTERHCNTQQQFNMNNQIESKKDPQFAFYEEIMDVLHFNIFHLYDFGLRCKINNDFDKNSNEKCIDYLFGHMKDIIYTQKRKYNQIFDRFSSPNNKYNIQFEHKLSMNKNNLELTWTDHLLNHLNNISVLNKVKMDALHSFLLCEEYDTDATTQDLELNSGCFTSNISNVINSLSCVSAIKAFIVDSRLSSTKFSTGLIFWYWPYYHPSKIQKRRNNNAERVLWNNINDYSGYDIMDLYINGPKYTNLKQEIINSGYCTVRQFNQKVVLKSTKLIYTNIARQTKADWNSSYVDADIEQRLHYGIHKGTTLSLFNIQSIICYCDFTDLCTSFSSTFRAKYYGESLSSIKKRNTNYYHLSKTLRETVEYFGVDGDKRHRKWQTKPIYERGPFFCGVSSVMVLSAFNLRLCGPTSTSKQKEIAINFAQKDGIIIQLNNNGAYGDRKRLRFFNCAWISTYGYENERLFFGGEWTVRLQSILIVKTMQNFKIFFNALFHFDCMLTGITLFSSLLPGKSAATKAVHYKPKINQRDHDHLDDVIKYELGIVEKMKFDPYIHDTFHLFCMNKAMICMNLYYLDREFGEISDLIMYSLKKDKKDKNNFSPTRNLFRPLVFRLFPNVKEIIIYTTDRFGTNVHTFSLSTFKNIYASVDAFKHSTKVILKAVQPVYNMKQSWLASISLDNQQQVKMSLKITKDKRNRKEDCLTITKIQ